MLSTDNGVVTSSMPRRRSFLQFSLRTLLICVLIFGALFGCALLSYLGVQTARRTARTRMTLQIVAVSASQYYATWNQYPPTPTSGKLDLSYVNTLSPMLPASIDSNSIQNNEVLDPWGNPYRLKAEGHRFRIWSCGPNGIDEDGKGDDIP